MNNVETFDDFVEMLKNTFPNIRLDQRDEMIIRMAINHAYLVNKEEDNE